MRFYLTQYVVCFNWHKKKQGAFQRLACLTYWDKLFSNYLKPQQLEQYYHCQYFDTVVE
jgi:hypothetical protein